MGAYAQPQCEVRTYTIRDGLPSNIISCADEDPNGLMWFGSWRGLCCFDGYEFLGFAQGRDTLQSPMCLRMQTLKCDILCNVWCVTYDRRLYYFRSDECRFVDVSDIIERKFGKKCRIHTIHTQRNGVTWFTCYPGEKAAFRVSDPHNIEGITDEYDSFAAINDNLSKVFVDEEENEWLLLTSGTILKFVAGQGIQTVKREGELERARQNFIEAAAHMHTDTYGRRWKADIFVEGEDGTVWMADKGGPLTYYDEDEDKVKPYCLAQNNYHTAVVGKYFIDTHNNVWVMGHHNLTRITPRPAPMHFTPGRENRTVRAVMPHGHPDEVDGKQIYSYLVDSRGREWVGTRGGGVYVDGRNYHKNDADDYSLEGKDVYDIFEDSHNRVWVVCYDGGFNMALEQPDGSLRFANQKNTFARYPKGAHFKVRRVVETDKGVIIFTTSDGIVCFSSDFSNTNDIDFVAYSYDRAKPGSLPGGNAMQTLQASDGHLYIATMNGGLYTDCGGEALAGTLKFAPVPGTLNGNGIILSFVEAHDQSLWLARETMLDRYDLRSGRLMTFGPRDFGREISFTEALPKIDDRSNRIAMGALGGVFSFDTQEMNKGLYEPPILFSAVRYKGENVKHPIIYAGELNVPAHKRDLTIYFAALDYQDNNQIRYAYKLDDDDADWNYVWRGHSAAFNNFPPGRHTLLVRCTNADGVWGTGVASLPINAEPTFAETPWPWVLLAVAFVLSVCGCARLVLSVENKKKRQKK